MAANPKTSPQRIAYIREHKPGNVTAQEFVDVLDHVAWYLRLVDRNCAVDEGGRILLRELLTYVIADEGDLTCDTNT